MMKSTLASLIGCSLLSLAAPAFAQDGDASPVSNAPDGQYAVMRGVQGPAGLFSARLLLDINLSTDRVGQPASFVPRMKLNLRAWGHAACFSRMPVTSKPRFSILRSKRFTDFVLSAPLKWLDPRS